MADGHKLTTEEKKNARSFCDFLYKVPVNTTFTLWNLQGELRIVNPGVPDEQTYADHLRFAAKERWIEPIEGEPDAYRRTQHNRNIAPRSKALMRGELQAFKDKLIASLSGRAWID